MTLSILMLATIDTSSRDLASLAMGCDLTEGVEIRYNPAGAGRLRCLIADLTGLVRRIDIPLRHDCVSCTLRDDLVGMLAWVAAQRRWDSACVVLPVGAATRDLADDVATACISGRLPGAKLASVLCVVDPATLLDDLFGDDLLSERGLQLGDHDARAVGQALAGQLDESDVVATVTSPEPLVDAVLNHVLPPGVSRINGLGNLDATQLVQARYDQQEAQVRLDPTQAKPRSLVSSGPVWTLDLASDKAFHPQRLLGEIKLLGSGKVRGRGCFWLPSRPDQICHWDGSGGQLSIGDAGSWGGRRPFTRLLISGIDAADRERIRRSFANVRLTDFESVDAVSRWRGRDDGLDPWLGITTESEAG